MNDDNKNIKLKMNWGVFWTAGFLFTLGYVGIDSSLSTLVWYKQTLVWIVSYLLWPLILGLELGGS